MKFKKILATTMLALCVACGIASAQVTDPAPLNNQGVEYYERGNYAAAAKKFEDAILVAPNNVDLYLNLGYTYQAAENHDAAAKAFKKAIALDPSNYEAHNSLGVSLYRIGEKNRAMAEWEFVLSLEPGNASAAANLGMARHPEIADEIISQTKAALKPTAKDTRALSTLFRNGKNEYKKGNYETAAKYMSDVLEVKPESKFSYYYLGMSLAYLNRPNEAMKNLREYLIIETYPPEGAVEYEKAMAAFKTLQNGKSLRPSVNVKEMKAAKAFKEGKNAYAAKDFFKTIHYMKQASAIKPESYPVNYYLGMAYREVGDRERATFYLTKCLLAGPSARSKEEAVRIAAILKDLTN